MKQRMVFVRNDIQHFLLHFIVNGMRFSFVGRIRTPTWGYRNSSHTFWNSSTGVVLMTWDLGCYSNNKTMPAIISPAPADYILKQRMVLVSNKIQHFLLPFIINGMRSSFVGRIRTPK